MEVSLCGINEATPAEPALTLRDAEVKPPPSAARGSKDGARRRNGSQSRPSLLLAFENLPPYMAVLNIERYLRARRRILYPIRTICKGFEHIIHGGKLMSNNFTFSFISLINANETKM